MSPEASRVAQEALKRAGTEVESAVLRHLPVPRRWSGKSRLIVPAQSGVPHRRSSSLGLPLTTRRPRHAHAGWFRRSGFLAARRAARSPGNCLPRPANPMLRGWEVGRHGLRIYIEIGPNGSVQWRVMKNRMTKQKKMPGILRWVILSTPSRSLPLPDCPFEQPLGFRHDFGLGELGPDGRSNHPGPQRPSDDVPRASSRIVDGTAT